jgi:hypothetical protein
MRDFRALAGDIGAGRSLGTPGQASCKRQVSGSIPLTGSQSHAGPNRALHLSWLNLMRKSAGAVDRVEGGAAFDRGEVTFSENALLDSAQCRALGQFTSCPRWPRCP